MREILRFFDMFKDGRVPRCTSTYGTVRDESSGQFGTCFTAHDSVPWLLLVNFLQEYNKYYENLITIRLLWMALAWRSDTNTNTSSSRGASVPHPARLILRRVCSKVQKTRRLAFPEPLSCDLNSSFSTR